MTLPFYGIGGPGSQRAMAAPIVANRDPTSSDRVGSSGITYQIGQIWINTSTLTEFTLLAPGTWVATGGPGSEVNSISGNTGTATPTNGDIRFLGSTTQGISFTAAGSVVTSTISDATTSQKGVSELSTDAESIAGSDSTVCVTPSSLKAKLGTQTNHGVLVGAGQTAAITALSVGASNSILMGNTGADPAFTTTGTPYVSGISFDAGTNTLQNYVNAGTWTPTLDGATPGSTTYTTQSGAYIRVGNMVYITGFIVITAATGTGQAQLGGFPFNIRNTANANPQGSCFISAAGWAWPAGVTMLSVNGVPGNTIAVITGSGSSSASANLQMTNAAFQIHFSLLYMI